MITFSRLRIFFFSISLSITSILLCFLASEFYLTLRYNKERERLTSVYGDRDLCTIPSESPELVYTRIPSKCGANSHGFRDYEYGYNKDKGIFRIVVIGDSVAEGHGVEVPDTFPKVLEKKLNLFPGEGGEKVEIIVLAQSGYSTSQELFLLEQEAFKYAPDLILWSYVLNDPAHPVYHNSNGELGRYYYKPRFHTVSYVYRKLFEIRERFSSSRCETEYHALIFCVYWNQVVSDIGKIAQISAKFGVPTLFIIHPLFEEAGNFDAYSLAPVHAKLRAAASAAGLPVVDLLEAYKHYKPLDLTLPNTQGHDPLHPNEIGHRIAADYIATFLTEHKYLH